MESTNEMNKWKASEIQLSYRSAVKPSMRPKISGSEDAYKVLQESWDKSTIELFEQFRVMFVNRSNRVLGLFLVSSGGISGTTVDPKLIFVAALKSGATGLILSHNHPSGNLTPSQADIQLTKKVNDGGKLLDIQLLDHIIVTQDCYFSFADEGIL